MAHRAVIVRAAVLLRAVIALRRMLAEPTVGHVTHIKPFPLYSAHY